MAAVDLGAQSGRVAVGSFDGAELQLSEVHRFPNAPVQAGERLEWDFERLCGEALAGLRAAGAVDSVGVDSWAVDFGLVDAAGRLVGNPVAYRDTRRSAAFDDVLANVVEVRVSEHQASVATTRAGLVSDALRPTAIPTRQARTWLKDAPPLWLMSAPPSVLAGDLALHLALDGRLEHAVVYPAPAVHSAEVAGQPDPPSERGEDPPFE